ncbi:hypothetical protein GCM10023347_51770 [Streptomyces chumphonensis]
MKDEAQKPAAEQDRDEPAEDGLVRVPTLAELNERREALNARVTDHFNLLKGRRCERCTGCAGSPWKRTWSPTRSRPRW